MPPVSNYLLEKERDGGISAVMLTDLFNGVIDPEVADGCIKAVETLHSVGAEVTRKTLPDLSELKEAHQISMLAYAHSVHTMDMEHREDIYPQVWDRLQKGDIHSTLYLQLTRKKTNLFQLLMDKLGNADCLVYPTTPVAAYRIGEGEKPIVINGTATTPYQITGYSTWMGSFSGLPVLSLPVGKTKAGMPFGLSLLGRRYDEGNLYRIGEKLMRAIM